MRFVKLSPVLLGLLMLAGCGLSDQDRALLSSANQNASEAKQIAQQALTTSQSAAANASQASEKADRMFQRDLRK